MKEDSSLQKIKSIVLKKSIEAKNKKREAEDWLLKLDLDPKGDLVYITLAGYASALDDIIKEIKSIEGEENDKTNGANLFNRNRKSSF